MRPFDSISFAPTLLGRVNQQRRHDFLYWEYHTGNRSTQGALVDGRWKGMRDAPSAPLELYDLAADPGEARDIAAQHPELVARIAEYLKTTREDSPNWPLLDPPKSKPAGKERSRTKP